MLSQKPLTDSRLLRAAQAGDSACLGLLLERHRARLYALALRFFGVGAQAEDAVSDTMLIAIGKLHQVRSPELVGSWLNATLRSVCLQQIRSRRKEITLDHLEVTAHADRIASEHGLEDMIDSSAAKEWIWDALESLSESLRVTAMLRHFGMHASYDEIALILGVPVGTVRSRLAQARSKLMERLVATTDAVFQDRQALIDSHAAHYRDQISAFYSGNYEATLAEYARDLVFVDNGKRIPDGWKSWKKYIESDLTYGSRFHPTRFMVSGRIVIIEGRNTNSDKFPDRCPPATTGVYFHRGSGLLVERLHMFYAAKPKPINS